MSRFSIANSLRLIRATRGATARAALRHGKRDDVAALLRKAGRLANVIEAVLLDARRRTRHHETARAA